MAIEKKFKVSAIVPLFNGEQFISESIESLLSQTCPIDEIIVIDDKSTDQGLKIVRKLIETNQTVKLLRNPSNKGSSHCRNLGIKESSGDYILFLDQDDYLGSNYLEEISNHLMKHSVKETAGVHSSYFIVDENGENPNEISYDEINSDEFLGYQFLRNRILSNSGTIIKKSILDQTGLYDESLKFSQDWDLWLRIGKIEAISYLKKPLTFIRRHSNNTSKKIEGFLNDERTILQKYDLDFIKESINRRKVTKYENEIAFLSILFRLGTRSRLMQELENIKDVESSQLDHHFYYGLVHFDDSNWEESIRAFSKIKPDSNYYLSAQNNLGALYILTKKWALARTTLTMILREKPDYLDAINNNKLANEVSEKNDCFPAITKRPLRETLYSYT
jgi:glycosyltransferase involved in cell wall biosynthesis